MRRAFIAIVIVLLAGSAGAGEWRVEGPAPIVVPHGEDPPVVYGQEQNRILEIKRAPEVPEYRAPRYEPIEVEEYEAPDWDELR